MGRGKLGSFFAHNNTNRGERNRNKHWARGAQAHLCIYWGAGAAGGATGLAARFAFRSFRCVTASEAEAVTASSPAAEPEDAVRTGFRPDRVRELERARRGADREGAADPLGLSACRREAGKETGRDNDTHTQVKDGGGGTPAHSRLHSNKKNPPPPPRQ